MSDAPHEACPSPDAGAAAPRPRPGAKFVPMAAEPPLWAKEDPAVLELLKSRPGRLRLALTGGIASGKSTVAELFYAFGAEGVDFDLLARQVVAPGSPGLLAVKEIFGPKYILPDGAMDRRKVGKAVFKNPALKAALEAVIHPGAWALMAEELRARAEAEAIVVSVPLLFEAGLETLFDPIVLCFADPATQLARLRARDRTLGFFAARRVIKNQWPAAAKLTRCRCIIDNGRSMAETIRQTKAIWDALRRA